MSSKQRAIFMDAPSPPKAAPWSRVVGGAAGGRLSGGRPNGRRWRAAAPILVTFGIIWLAYLAIVAIVIATDPYDIYRWGSTLQSKRSDMPSDRLRAINIAAKKASIDTFLVGGSTTEMYSPNEISAALGGKAIAYNLSYGGPRPLDRDIVLDLLAETSQAKHIIITFDWMYILGSETIRRNFPEFLYDEEITDDIRMVDLKALRRTLKVLLGIANHGPDNGENYAHLVAEQRNDFHQPARMAELDRLVEEFRPVIDAPSGRTCRDFGAVNEQLVPRVRAFSQKGVKIDILMPILSYVKYYHNVSNISPTILDEVLTSRKCLVDAIDGLPNVRVFGFDDDPAIAGDLGNFRDPAHIDNPALLKRTLASLSTGEKQLTAANVDEYLRRIRSEVKNYHVRNSYLERTR